MSENKTSARYSNYADAPASDLTDLGRESDIKTRAERQVECVAVPLTLPPQMPKPREACPVALVRGAGLMSLLKAKFPPILKLLSSITCDC